ncbi:Cna B-type domain-containing protein [Bacillus sp. FJAT-49732]|uniref:Cna B-type domain-containing protein n=1 Tax=Lederbergia citrisecunda TaxID=2833583 RepID=A0A942TSY8_9BACI|nr:Cna B-type domain-containing protein [Lederbergia citrisecunda]MBS4202392.1 Cna B-type domain-containing protein [Lederbergia citrisecunda]
MRKKISMIVFIIVLISNTILSGAAPLVVTAETVKKSIFTNVTLTDEKGNVIDANQNPEFLPSIDTAVNVNFEWSISSDDLTGEKTFLYDLPSQIMVHKVQSGLLFADEDEIGTFQIDDNGKITLEFLEEAEGYAQVSGKFSIDAAFNEKVIGDSEEISILFGLGGLEKLIDINFEGSSDSQSGNVEDEETTPEVDQNDENGSLENGAEAKEEEIDTEVEPVDNQTAININGTESKEKVTKVQSLNRTVGEINENIITDVMLSIKEGEEDFNEILPGTEIVVGSPYNEFKVKLDYQFALPNGHPYGKGSTFTIEIPDVFNVLANPEPQPLKKGNIEFATFIVTSDNKIVITFNEKIEENSDVSGYINLESEFAAHYKGSAETEITFPIEGKGNVTYPIRFIPNSTSIDKQGVPNKGYNTETIQWTVDFNKDLQKINNAILEDFLGPNQELVADSIEVYKLAMNADGTIDESKTEIMEGHGFGETFPLTLGNIDSAYRIVYKSKVTDNLGTSYTNKATLDGDEIEPISADASVVVKRGQQLEKDSTEYDNVSQTITWEVKYNYDEKVIPQNKAKLTDVFGKNQQFVEGSFKVVEVEINSNTGDEAGTTDVSSDAYTVTHTEDGFVFLFNEGINKAYKIVYKTTASNRVDKDGNIENTISDEFENVIKGGRFVSQGIFIKSHDGNPDYDKKETSWTILINRDEQLMKEVAFFDTLPQGFTPKNVKVTHDGKTLVKDTDYTYNYDENTRRIEIDFIQDITKRVYITYETEIDYDKVNPQNGKFTNNALLEWIPENETKKISKEGTADFDPDNYTKHNGFKGASYNPVTKEITWTIGVNYNRATLNNVIVEDFILGEQNFKINNVKVYHMTLTGGANGFEKGAELTGADIRSKTGQNNEPGFSVHLGNIKEPYVIEFTTDLKGLLVDKNYNNIATVKSNNKDENELKATVQPHYGGEYTKKDAKQNVTNPRIVNWNVNINFTQSTVSNLKIEDTPSINQALLRDTIKVYGTTVTENSIMKDLNKLLVEGQDYTLEMKESEDGRETFTIKFTAAKIDRAYVLEYDTYILYKGDGNISNDAQFFASETTGIETGDKYSNKINLSNISGGIDGEVGNLKVTKVDNDDDSMTLKGAVFELYDETGKTLLKTATTGEDGVSEFKNLLYARYILKETTAPDGYVVGIEDKQTVKVNAPVTELEIKNKKIKRHVELTKVDGTDGRLLDGVVFELYKDNNLVSEHTTDNEGIIYLEDFEPGNYYFKEKTPKQHYQQNDNEYRFTIEEKQTEVDKVIVKNELIPGSAKIKKVDADNTSKGLKGAVFEILTENKKSVKTVETGEDGTVRTGDLRPGKYLLKEIQAPYGYNISDQEAKDGIEFEIVHSQVTPIDIRTITNEVKTTKIELTKKDAISGNLLPGAEFELTYQAGPYPNGTTVIKTADSSGKVTFEDLKPGTYSIKESKAPEGYILNTTPIIVEVTLNHVHNNQTVKKDIQNDPFVHVILVKEDSETAYKLADAKFKITDQDDIDIAGYTNLTTDNNGQINITGLPAGSYKLVEVEPPFGYTIDSNNIRTFEITGNELSTNVIEYRDSDAFKNNIIKGSVELLKKDAETGGTLEGVEFELQNISLVNGGTYGTTPHTTDANGKIFVNNLRPGKYKFIEKKAKDGYQLHWKEIVFDIDLGNQKHEQTITVENYKLVDIGVTKKWNDDNDSAGSRPESITVDLLQNGTKLKDATISPDNNGNWTQTFTGLDAVDSNGKKYTYTVVEQPVDNYQREGITGNAVEGFVITNTLLTSVEVEKAWEDDNDATKNRPSQVKVELYQNNQKYKEATVKASDNWKYTFAKLPVYDSNGNKYHYTVKEETVTGYELKNIESTNNGYKVINVRTGKADINVTKTWKDENELDRPSEVIVELYQNNQKLKEATVKASGNWKYAFENLEVFDTDGKAYDYTVKEKDLDGNYKLDGITGDAEKGFEITNVRTGKTNIKVTKVWKDEKESDRPSEIKVELYQNGTHQPDKDATIKASEGWEYTFNNLEAFDADGKAYEYTVKEVDLDGKYKLEGITGNAKDGFTITNVRTGKTEINVTKVWKDENELDRPTDVKVELYRNGIHQSDKDAVIKRSDGWECTFKDLEVYDSDGKAYVYTVKEKDLDSNYTLEGITGNAKDGFIITNVRTDKTKVEGMKSWKDDNENDRPEMIKVNLLQNDVVVDTQEVTKDSDWKYSFTNLEKYDKEGKAYKYSVKEQGVPGYKSEVNGFDITNTRSEKTIVEVTKAWKDDNAKDRPESITVTLLQNDKEIETVEITAADDWTYEFSDLEAFDENGVAYEYTVEEEAIGGYETTIDGYDITNLRVGKTTVEGAKAWKDDNSKERPEMIKVDLLKNGEVINTKEVTADDDWKYSFTNLDKFDEEGKAYEYTVLEQPIEGYRSTVEGYDITNVRVGKTSVEGKKTWKDNNSKERPEMIKVNLLQNRVVVATQEVTADTDWKYSFKDLDKYDEEGKVYEYAVKEQGVPGYKSDVDGFDITNTRSDKTSVVITKGWKDDNSKDRPDSITVNLLQNGEVIDTVKVTATDDWTYEFSDLEAYDKNGVAYEYTVEEEAIEGYETTVDGYDITNLRVGETSIEGTKTWEDDNFKERPKMIKVDLLQNGKVVDTVEATADTDWKYTFTNLEKYDAEGKAYTYSVKEHVVEGYESIVSGFDITNKLILGEVELTKHGENEEVLEGAIFDLQDLAGNVLQEGLTTNKAGKLVVSDLKPGHYQFVETKAPFAHELDSTPIKFTIEIGPTKPVQLTAMNELTPGSVELIKVDSNNKKITLEGAEFELQNKDGYVLLKGLSTDKTGKLVVENLKPGNYQFVEKKAPTGYDLDPTPITFTIEKGQEEMLVLEFANKATPLDPEQPEKPGKPEKPSKPEQPVDPGKEVRPEKPSSGINKLPQTGEQNLFYMMIIGFLFLSIGGVLLLRRNRKAE